MKISEPLKERIHRILQEKDLYGISFKFLCKGLEQLSDDSCITFHEITSPRLHHLCPICNKMERTIFECRETLQALENTGCHPIIQFVCIGCQNHLEHFIPKVRECIGEMYLMGIKMECDNCYYEHREADDVICGRCYSVCNWQPNFFVRKNNKGDKE